VGIQQLAGSLDLLARATGERQVMPGAPGPQVRRLSRVHATEQRAQQGGWSPRLQGSVIIHEHGRQHGLSEVFGHGFVVGAALGGKTDPFQTREDRRVLVGDLERALLGEHTRDPGRRVRSVDP
jgi:hypothetical protein